jgi:hypothetical protein
MNNNKTGKYIKYAIGEIVLVVIGILIALQINNWNQSRKEAKQEQLILKKLEVELQEDIKFVQNQIETGIIYIEDFKFCLDVLSNQKESSLEEFHKHFSSSIIMTLFDINRTTFNSITESRTIDYIQNDILVDSLNSFYNDNYKGWDTANKDYTRNVIGPYLMNFDYLPVVNYDRYEMNTGGFSKNDFAQIDVSKFEIKPKSIEDFKKDIFIINILRQRLFLTEGQVLRYKQLKRKMESLVKQIQVEMKK